MNEQLERKAQRVLTDALDAIEDFSNRYEHDSADHRLRLVQLLAGLCLATVLERGGPWRLIRTIYGATVVAIRHRGLVTP